MYCNGLGVTAPDQEKAFTLIKMAAVQGYKTAQCMAGIFCQNGLGTAADTNEARRWCQLSAAQGVKDAIKFLKSLPEQHDDHANECRNLPACLSPATPEARAWREDDSAGTTKMCTNKTLLLHVQHAEEVFAGEQQPAAILILFCKLRH